MTVDGLSSEDDSRFEASVSAAVRDADSGESALINALRHAGSSRRTTLVVALGEASGARGGEVLRTIVLDRANNDDTRSAGIVALAKREGERASDVFAALLADDDAAARRYALKALGCVGDDRAWDEAFGVLAEILPTLSNNFPFAMNARMLSVQSEALSAVVYLARHLDSPERAEALAKLIRANWDRLSKAEQDWLHVYWPSVIPDYPQSVERPDPEELSAWLRHPLLNSLFGTAH